MPKSRLQKTALVERYQSLLTDATMVVVVSVAGVTVGEAEQVRDAFFDHGQTFVVVKNNLLTIALRNLNLALPEDVTGVPLAICVASGDEVTVSKDVTALAKQFEKMATLAGIYKGEVVTTAVVESLASLPSRDELLAKTVGTIAAPLTGFVNVVRGNITNLLNVLRNIEHEKQNS